MTAQAILPIFNASSIGISQPIPTPGFASFATPAKGRFADTVAYAVRRTHERYPGSTVHLLCNPADEAGLVVPEGAVLVTTDGYRQHIARGVVAVVTERGTT